MKKIFLILLVLTYSLIAHSQRVQDTYITYDYLKQPIQKVDPSIKTYNVKTEISWAEAEAQKQLDYEQELLNAEEEYQTALKEYKEKKTGKKILEKALLDQGEPKKRHVRKPLLVDVPGTDMLSSNISLEGFEMGQSNALTIKVTLGSLETTGPVDGSTVKTEKKDGVETKTTLYHVYGTIRQLVSYEVMDPSGKIIYSETVESSQKSIRYTSSNFTSRAKRNTYRNNSWNSYISSKQSDLFIKRVKDANASLNNQFGYVKTARSVYLYCGVGKKHNYDQQKLCVTKAKRSFESIYEDRESSIAKLKISILFWENELKESNPDDKKARINKKVTAGLHCNIAEAQILIGEYNNAEDHLDQVDILGKVKAKFSKRAEGLRNFLSDEKKRNK